jgi:hypothetical protein
MFAAKFSGNLLLILGPIYQLGFMESWDCEVTAANPSWLSTRSPNLWNQHNEWCKGWGQVTQGRPGGPGQRDDNLGTTALPNTGYRSPKTA